ncbi:arabinogalactan protein 24-like [Andrographis paniculata]|uniref:arabinogalactan protein 24-like n=1 Tax=Andrographis paniculata TaxID=175694 RepID=UPI0021E87B87|nr:arabinogalactan protein 24-like [Andrographis paniculata]
MASGFTGYLGCIVLLVAAVVVAHEGHDHMAPAPSPPKATSTASMNSPLATTAAGLFTLAAAFLAIIGKMIIHVHSIQLEDKRQM